MAKMAKAKIALGEISKVMAHSERSVSGDEIMAMAWHEKKKQYQHRNGMKA
jgi:hypothetical protein